MKVTVIIATFNAAPYIRKAIKSFLSQTFVSKELVIIDGGSSDETLSIINEYQDKKFHIISEPDKGVYDAMNKGVQLANGEWIYFLGADDFFMNERVLEQVFENKLEDFDIVYGDVFSVLLNKNYDGPTNKEKLLFSNLCHQSIFYRKEVFETAGLYNLKYKLFADWEFNIRCFIHYDFRTVYIPVVIAEYAASGISTLNKDLDFIRNFLFFENLNHLYEVGIDHLGRIGYYDRWWRLLRSMATNENLQIFARGIAVPELILKMHSFQKKIHQRMLHCGITSKICMALSFIFNR